MLQRMFGPRVCAARFFMIITTIHPTQRLPFVFLERFTALFCRKKHRNLLLVIPPWAAIAIVMTSGPGFALLCNFTKQCYAN